MSSPRATDTPHFWYTVSEKWKLGTSGILTLGRGRSVNILTVAQHAVGCPRPVFSYKLRYIAGFGLVEMAISTNLKPAIYRNLHENTDPGDDRSWPIVIRRGIASGRTR